MDSFTVADSNAFFESLGNSSDSAKQIFRDVSGPFFLILSWICMYSLELSLRDRHTIISIEDRKEIAKLSSFVSWPGALINPQWLELPMSGTNFHSPKDVRTIEVRQYIAFVMVLSYIFDAILFDKTFLKPAKSVFFGSIHSLDKNVFLKQITIILLLLLLLLIIIMDITFKVIMMM